MGRLGLPVPPGFTITTDVCDLFYKNKKKLPKKVIQNIEKELKNIEKKTKKKFGDLKNPLASLSKIWSQNFYAWHDGYNFKSWP